MGYAHLTKEERYQTWALRGAGLGIREIARRLDRSPSTISRELRRNRGQRGYRCKQAHRLAQQRAGSCRSRRRIAFEQWQAVERLLRRDWSPEQIAARLRLEGGLRVSHEWIYQFIYADKQLGGGLHRHLRIQKKRKRYGSGRQRRGRIIARRGIEERPRAADERSEIGHWEVDTMIGKRGKSTCLTAVERRSRFTRIAKLQRRTAKLATQRLNQRLKPLMRSVRTITGDNGKEFSDHPGISSGLDCQFYFADPYASWQRGTNENTNGLIRQYLPSQRDLGTLTGGEIQKIEKRLNHRPRKCLGFLTPHEVFYDTRLKLTVALRS